MKRSVLLIVLLVVLLGIYWLVQTGKPVVSADRPFVEIDSAKVTSLRVATAQDSVELQKQGDAWYVKTPVNYPAAKNAVAQALGKFKEMNKLSLISDKADRQAEFQVESKFGTRITEIGRAHV
jgi:hypothetical protein